MKKKVKTICIIPARSGSKRIKNKNIKFFFGKPILAWSIEAAIKSNCFDKIIVSTNDKKIAKIAKKYSAEIPFLRPKNLSNDHVSILSVVRHSLKELSKINFNPEITCCLLATAPFVDYKDIQKSMKLLISSKKNFAITVKSFSYPVQRALKISKRNHISMIDKKKRNIRSQDLQEAYHDAGQFYLGKTKNFLRNDEIFSKNSIPIILERFNAIDIDTIEDWKEAEMLFKLKKLKKNARNK